MARNAKGISPDVNSRKKLKEEGWLVEKVEYFNFITKRKKDLFGFIDLLALKDGETLAVQATSKAHISDRVKKIESDELHEQLSAVREAGWRIEVWGWYKDKNRWKVKIVDVS